MEQPAGSPRRPAVRPEPKEPRPWRPGDAYQPNATTVRDFAKPAPSSLSAYRDRLRHRVNRSELGPEAA